MEELPSAFFNAALEALQQGHLAEAMKAAGTASTLDSTDIEALVLFLTALEQAGGQEAADEFLSRLDSHKARAVMEHLGTQDDAEPVPSKGTKAPQPSLGPVQVRLGLISLVAGLLLGYFGGQAWRQAEVDSTAPGHLQTLDTGVVTGATELAESDPSSVDVPDDHENILEILSGVDANGSRQLVRVRILPGDTYWELARRFYDAPDRWGEIAAHNPEFADPRSLPVGSILVIPLDTATASMDMPVH